MPKRKAPKKINQEIIKAVRFLTDQNSNKTIKLADIVERVKFQVREIPFDQDMKKMIREAVYKLRDIGLIDYVGYNQYCCPEFLSKDEVYETLPPFPQPEAQPGKPDSRYFVPYTQKNVGEYTSCLDPNRKRRHPENESRSSLSGDELDRTRKRFYGKKIIKKSVHSPPLPGARQVPEKKRADEFESHEESADSSISKDKQDEIPVCSWDTYSTQIAAIPRSCCDIVQLSKSDDELIRATDIFEIKEQTAMLDSDLVEINGNEQSAANVENNERLLSAVCSNTNNG